MSEMSSGIIVFLWLTSLSVIMSRSVLVTANDIIYPNRSKMQMSPLLLDPEPQYALHINKLNDTPTSAMTISRQIFKANVWPRSNSLKSHHFPKIAGILLPLSSLWNNPLIKTDNSVPSCSSRLLRWLTQCLQSVFLSKKPTFYLSLCLSLNSSWEETSRTWESVSPETRCDVS